MGVNTHQYIDRRSGSVRTERLFGDRLVKFVYSGLRENAGAVFRMLTSAKGSALLGFLNFDTFLSIRLSSSWDLLRSWGVDVSELLDHPEDLNTPRKLFERKIRYWQCRPMEFGEHLVVAPADSRVLLGSFSRDSLLWIKDKFFDYNELIGERRFRWLQAFQDGDFAIFRLTPDKYHYVHTPVSGRVVDFYEMDGHHHSCNPEAVVQMVTPYSKNKRVVTIIDTDVPGGTCVGLVAVIEVVALMVGEIEQRYSPRAYEPELPVIPGMFVEKGRPKSLFRPGSSTVVCVFQEGRVKFESDLVQNQQRGDVNSRFSHGFGSALVETEVQVRGTIGRAPGHEGKWDLFGGDDCFRLAG